MNRRWWATSLNRGNHVLVACPTHTDDNWQTETVTMFTSSAYIKKFSN